MPLPAARFAMSNVGSTGREGSDSLACANAQVHRLLRSGQPAHWPIRSAHLPGVQCRDVSKLPRTTVASPDTAAPDDPRARQRSLSSCRSATSVSARTGSTAAALLPATLQSAALSDRARLEADSSLGDAQSLLPNARATRRGCQYMLRPLAAPERCVATTMLHYLSRCV